ncbi:MAG: hypothetical protein AB1679_26405 [Actinomycetota bacterium]|jgi:hypothetical protein
MKRGWQLTSLGFALLGLVGASFAPSPAGAEGFTSFEARALAEGVRMSFGAPNFVAVDTFMDGGGPVSQAVLDGLGNSQAFASSPYPGDLFLTGPGLVAGLTGLPSPPAYPFYVNSSYPTTEKAQVEQPGYRLEAQSHESHSRSSASSGGGSGDSAVMVVNTTASALRDEATGDVVAESTVKADIINIGGVLRIISGEAKAKATRSTGGELQRQSSLVLSGVSIAGQSVGFTDKGFVTGPNNTPLPDDGPAAGALKAAGITVQYLKGVQTDNGVISPGFVITHEFQPPGGPKMIAKYVFGRASASATAS